MIQPRFVLEKTFVQLTLYSLEKRSNMSSVKAKKQKMAYVKVSYDSGSDGDIESEEDEHMSKYLL